MAKYEASLNNDDCMFDAGDFDTAEEVVEWAKGRGGSYAFNVTNPDDDEFPGYSFGVVGGTSFWKKLPGGDGCYIAEKEVIKMIKAL